MHRDDEEDDNEDEEGEEDDKDDEESQQWTSGDSRVNAQKPSIMHEAAAQLHKPLQDTADEVKVQLLEEHDQAMNKLKFAFAHFDQQVEKDEHKLQESLNSAIVRKEKEQCTSKPVKQAQTEQCHQIQLQQISKHIYQQVAAKPRNRHRRGTRERRVMTMLAMHLA
jgi:translation initiation factor 2 alpha subunit (eIF-2alpha)